MLRRGFIRLLGVVTAWPLAAHAQQQTDRMRKIGLLMSTSHTDPYQRENYSAFVQRFESLGWIIGRNVVMNDRWAAGDPEQMLTHARQLVGLAPDAIVVQGSALPAMRRETGDIPIVFVLGPAPDTDLAHPSGNVTGFTHFEASMGGKWLELVKEVAPRLKRVAVLYDPRTTVAAAEYLRVIKSGASSVRIDSIIESPVRNDGELEGIVASVAHDQNGGLVVFPDASMVEHRDKIVRFATRYKIPAVYPFSIFCRGGGLLSYGVDVPDLFRRAAIYVDRILKGARPADLPVQQPSKFELVINLTTAKALGLTVPPSLLARADEVIE
jgi:putative ABC transport system substrate-binding protein